MSPQRARRKWLAPLLILVIVGVVLVLVVSGVALGDTTTTLTPSASALPAEGSTEGSPAVVDGALTAFTVKGSDLGEFSTQPPSIKSPAAIVVNAATGKVLYQRKADVRRPMASTTKIMTATLVLQDLPLDRKVTVSQLAASTTEPKALLRKGDVLTVEQLLYCLLLRSSNGAAVALAEAVDGSVSAFIEHMNAKAEELGLADTHFVTPNGLDADGHYSTASDMAKLARYAMQNERFRRFVSTKTYSLQIPGRSAAIELENTNKLLTMADWVNGIKTGLTPNADQCLVASGTRNGVSVISVVLGQPSTNVCWTESKALLDYGLKQFRHVSLVTQGTPVAEAKVPYQKDGTLRLVTAGSLETDVYKDDLVTASVKLDRALTLPVKAGEKFGEVVVTDKGQTVGSVDLVADHTYAETTLGSKIAYYWDRLTAWVGG